MEISTNTLLSQLNTNGQTTSNTAHSFCGVGCQQPFSEPAFTSQQLKEKWSGKFIDFGFGLNNQTSSVNNLSSNTAASTAMKEGHVAFENAHYTIDVNDKGEIKINNKDTGEHYRIWGDPHVDVDGKRAFDFKGDTSFILEDGTKITVETTPWKGNNGQTISSTVSIIDGESAYGVRITGVDDNQLGDLAYEEVPQFGSFLDAMLDDGNYVHENPLGQGFIAVGKDGWAEVDQSVMDFQENTLSRLGLDSLGEQTAGKQLLNDLFNNQGVTSSLADLATMLENFQHSNEAQGQLTEILTATLESLLSLAHQQSRSFAHLASLQTVQSSGSYHVPGADNGFTFQLNFRRS